MSLADGLGEDRTRVRARDDPHLTTRDWSVLGLESMLLGAHAEGVRNVLAITGDPPEVGDYPGSRGVYEVDAIGLTRLVSQLNRGEDFNGRPIDAPTSFFVGVAVNPTADDLELEVERFRRKVEEGARFAMTQIVYDFEAYDAFVDRLGGSWPIPVLAGILPLTSHRFALRLHNEVPGIVVPQELQDVEAAGADAADVGFAHAGRLVDASREKARMASTSSPRTASRFAFSTCSKRSSSLRTTAWRTRWRSIENAAAQCAGSAAHDRRARAARRPTCATSPDVVAAHERARAFFERAARSVRRRASCSTTRRSPRPRSARRSGRPASTRCAYCETPLAEQAMLVDRSAPQAMRSPWTERSAPTTTGGSRTPGRTSTRAVPSA